MILFRVGDGPPQGKNGGHLAVERRRHLLKGVEGEKKGVRKKNSLSDGGGGKHRLMEGGQPAAHSRNPGCGNSPESDEWGEG